jgi:hypothetical protein
MKHVIQNKRWRKRRLTGRRENRVFSQNAGGSRNNTAALISSPFGLLRNNMLVEINGCIFDKSQLKNSHGFEQLDSVGKEAFVNHVHLSGHNKEEEAENLIDGWTKDMK